MSAAILCLGLVGWIWGGRRRHIDGDGVAALRNGAGNLRKRISGLWEDVDAVGDDVNALKDSVNILWGSGSLGDGLNVRSEGVFTFGKPPSSSGAASASARTSPSGCSLVGTAKMESAGTPSSLAAAGACSSPGDPISSAGLGNSLWVAASLADWDAKNSDRFISTERNPIDRKIEANCSPEHPVNDVIAPLTTNPFEVRWLGRPTAPPGASPAIAARIMPASRSTTSTRTIRSPHVR